MRTEEQWKSEQSFYQGPLFSQQSSDSEWNYTLLRCFCFVYYNCVWLHQVRCEHEALIFNMISYFKSPQSFHSQQFENWWFDSLQTHSLQLSASDECSVWAANQDIESRSRMTFLDSVSGGKGLKLVNLCQETALSLTTGKWIPLGGKNAGCSAHYFIKLKSLWDSMVISWLWSQKSLPSEQPISWSLFCC